MPRTPETPDNGTNPLVGIPEIARYLDRSEYSVGVDVRNSRIPHYRIGRGRGSIRFRYADIDAWLEQCAVQPRDNTTPAPPADAPRRRPRRIVQATTSSTGGAA